MHFSIPTTGLTQNQKLSLICLLSKETQLKIRNQSYWYVYDPIENTLVCDSIFNYPSTPYLEVDRFGENAIFVSKLTNMEPNQREGLTTMVKEITKEFYELFKN